MLTVFKVSGGDDDAAAVSFTMNDLRWSYHTATRLGKRLSDIWQVQDVELDVRDGDHPLATFGCTNLGPFFMVYPRAMEVPEIANFLKVEGELLPVPIGEDTWHLFTPLRYVDALDDEKTEFDALDLREGIKSTRYPVFRASKLQGVRFFRIHEYWTPIYLAEPDTGGFKALYDSLGLKGLRFVEMPVTQD